MSYKEIFDDLIDMMESYTLIIGVIDIVRYKDNTYRCRYNDKYLEEIHPLSENFTKDNIGIMFGKGCPESILEDIIDHEFDVTKEGEYEFKSLLKYYPDETDDYGRTTMRGYYELVHTEMRFINSFESRNREERLLELLGNDNLFDI